MKTISHSPMTHQGQKIERIRRLRGLTQSDLANVLGISKQAVSKLEKSKSHQDETFKKVAAALGVTEDGLRNLDEELVLKSTYYFYKSGTAIEASARVNLGKIKNNFRIENTIEFFEKLLAKEREKFEAAIIDQP